MENFNIVTATDSYKLWHSGMYPEGTKYDWSYFEARKGAKFNKTMFYGLEILIKKYNLLGKVVTKEKIDKAERLSKRHSGGYGKFNRKGWEHILEVHDGYLPLEIRAVPEGLFIPNSNILMSVVNTDPENCEWLTGHIETLLTHVWYPSTVATLSKNTKELFKKYLKITCEEGEDFGGLNFMLHDFGMRGGTTLGATAIGGSGHLINFLGTDTISAMELLEDFYNYETGYSVNATQHSIMTAKGRKGEADVIEELLNKYPDGIFSMVSDSYDVYNCVGNICGVKFRDKILNRNGKFVFRPDSGNPLEVIPKLLDIIGEKFGYTTNTLGYKILNPKVGLIWGDGIDYDGIEAVLKKLVDIKWSVENMVFGMGGGLLQKVNRDTQRFAFKSSAQYREGKWHDIFKDPIDGSKTSKQGRLCLIKDENNEYKTVPFNEENSKKDILETVYLNGKLIRETKFEDIIKNSNL